MKNLIKVSLYLFALVAIFFVSNFINSNVVFAGDKVNINTADIVELDTLAGIGPAKAQAIIDYRDINGLFTRIEDIMNVSGIGEVTFTNIKDFITVVDLEEGDEDPEIITATTTDPVIATTTDPVISTSTATTTIITTPNTSTVISVHYIQESVSDYEEPTNIFELGIGRDRLSYVGSPINFKAKYKTSNDLKGKTPKYTWSLGDGFISSDKEVTHIYKYPGDYNVVLNANVGDVNSVSRTKVKVLIPELLLSATDGGDAEIINRGNNEINLYGMKIKSENQEYYFPLDTIISAKSSVIFPVEYLDISINSRELLLVDSQEKILSQINQNYSVANSDKVVTFAEFEKFAMAYRKNISTSIPENSNQISQTFVNNVSNPVKISPTIPLTASVVSTFIKSSSSVEVISDENNLIIENIQRGFWDKALHPIRTIKEAFY